MSEPLSPMRIAADATEYPCEVHGLHQPGIVITYPWWNLPLTLRWELGYDPDDLPVPNAFVCATAMDNILIALDNMLGRGPLATLDVGATETVWAHNASLAYAEAKAEMDSLADPA